LVAETAGSASTRSARWPWVALGGFLIAATAAMGFVVVRGASIVEQAPFVIAFAMFGVVGALILSRDPRNTIGGLFLYASCMTALAFLAMQVATWRADNGDTTGHLVAALIVLANAGWIVGLLPSLLFLFLVFPDGRLPSRRWRPFAWFVAVSLLSLLIAQVLGTETLTGADDVEFPNPLYVRVIDDVLGWLVDAGWLFILGVAGAVTALIVRFRRSRGAERQQLKWFAFAAAFVFSSAVVSEAVYAFAPSLELLTGIISGAAFLTLPLAVGVAVLKYRLYDLDVVVRKTLVYAALAVFAMLVYLTVVVGAGAWFGRDNSLLTMIAAVVVAVTFQPVRTRLTHVANRLVYGRRATPYEVLAEFSERVGGAYADEDVLARMARVLGEGVSAERADVWLKVDESLRDVAAWPDAAEPMGAVTMPNGQLPPIEGAERIYPVEHGGELLGALAVRKPASDPVTPADEKLVADLAAQAGLVLRNVRLTEELRARLDDLRAAQKRLVTAQDQERRRLERNIHDGAQQQLVALAVKARLARTLAERDPTKASEMLTQIEAETQTALEDLRDLARGIYPPLLADKGLVAALEAQARKSTLPVSVDGDGLPRYPQEVEAAIYFSGLEALQNVAKYATASHAAVRLREADGHLVVEIEDDGRGFDPASTGYGTGLQGIADRLAALGGTLAVRSAPGRGTTLQCRLPVLRASSRTEVTA
jgi:signal transduction histidine kinase